MKHTLAYQFALSLFRHPQADSIHQMSKRALELDPKNKEFMYFDSKDQTIPLTGRWIFSDNTKLEVFGLYEIYYFPNKRIKSQKTRLNYLTLKEELKSSNSISALD